MRELPRLLAVTTDTVFQRPDFSARATALARHKGEDRMTLEFRPFRIAVPDADLDDLRARLGQTRFPNAIEGIGWDQGTELEYLRELIAYWRDRFDWRVDCFSATVHQRQGAAFIGSPPDRDSDNWRSPHPQSL